MSTQQIDSELKDEFESWVNDPETNVLDELWEYVVPYMKGRERARKSVLVSLASHTDKGGIRGRCHCFMVGPPGTGKTTIRDWVRDAIPTAHGIGPKSSEAGLKGDASGKEFTPGALSMAHGGVLCIEELDKFAKSERDALYEAMSDGSYEINQGEIRDVYPAEIRTIATGNGTEPFKPALLDRFDFVIEMDEYTEDETVEVSDNIYDNFEKAFIKGEIDHSEPVIKQYLKWIEPEEPGQEGPETLDKIKKMKNHLISKKDFTGNIREKETWLRVAYCIAKLNRRDMTAEDFVRGIELLYPDLDTSPLRAIMTGDIEEML